MRFQFLKVTAAADDLQLLTIEELRTAAGVSGSGSDTELEAIGLRVAAAITADCDVAIAAGGEPTLLQEDLEETFFSVHCDSLFLSRRHDIEVSSITVDGVDLVIADDVLVDPEAGLLTRLSGGMPAKWHASKIVVAYTAGFETPPGDLKMAAMDFVRLTWVEKDRDPSLKMEIVDVPNVRRVERQYWVGSVPGQSSASAVPDIVAGQLQRYRNLVFA